ncbi:MAG: hypothetical protein ACRDKT_09675 [Actinomycetota bacterium]
MTADERPTYQGDPGLTNPLRFCEQLYAVVVGLGLALAANHVVQFSQVGGPVRSEHIPLFVAYLAFAFPLAHAAVRYIDLAYVEQRFGPTPPARGIMDVLLDGVRMWWLIALALHVAQPENFAYLTIFLFASELGRAALSRVLGRRPPSRLERNLTILSAGTLVVAGVLLLIAQVGVGNDAGVWIVRIGIHVTALTYAVAMYAGSYSYFFNPVPR